MARIVIEGFGSTVDAAAFVNNMRKQEHVANYTTHKGEVKKYFKIAPGGQVSYDSDITIKVEEASLPPVTTMELE